MWKNSDIAVEDHGGRKLLTPGAHTLTFGKQRAKLLTHGSQDA